MADENTQDYQTESLRDEETTRLQWLEKRGIICLSRFWMIRIPVSNDETDLDLERLQRIIGMINYMIVCREIGSPEGCCRLQGYIQFQKKHSIQQVQRMVRFCNFFDYSTKDPVETSRYFKQNLDYFEYGHLSKSLFIKTE